MGYGVRQCYKTNTNNTLMIVNKIGCTMLITIPKYHGLVCLCAADHCALCVSRRLAKAECFGSGSSGVPTESHTSRNLKKRALRLKGCRTNG